MSWTQKGPMWSWLGTGFALALIRGRMEMSGLIGRSSESGANRGLSEPLWVANPGGRRAARGRRGWRVHFLARAADGR